MSIINAHYVIFTFARHEGDAVTLHVRDADEIYLNLNVYVREDCFTEDCKHMIDFLHGRCQLDNNWQHFRGPYYESLTDMQLVKDGLVARHRLDMLAF